MAVTERQKAQILQLLRDNPHMSSYEASNALTDLGLTVSYRTIANYRRANNIDFDGRISLAKRLKADIEAGLDMSNAKAIAKKYRCSISHVNKSLREVRGLPVHRRENKVVAVRSE